MDLLILLLVLPAMGALLILLLPPIASHLIRRVALSASLLTMLYAFWLYLPFDSADPAIQMLSLHEWNARLGTSFALGIDGFSYPLVVLTTLLVFLAIVVSTGVTQRLRGYYMLLLLLESATLGVFVAQDWALFYVFWEMVLIPLFFLIDRWGGVHRQTAALNFVLYTMGGSVFMLLSLLVLFDSNPDHSFLFSSINRSAGSLSTETQVLIFFGLLLGFGVKVPLFPLHGWLPLAHVEAPAPVSILLSGILLKMGGYGLIRAAETLPQAIQTLQNLLLALGLAGLIYGGLLAWRQADLKKMIAYSSVSHMGVVIIGIATLSELGLAGAMFQMVAHGLVAGALFMLIGLLYERTRTRNINDYGSLIQITPRFALLIILAFTGGVGLPGTAGFVGELHILIAGFLHWGWLIALFSLGVLITGVYSIQAVRQLYTGPVNPAMQSVKDLSFQEMFAAGLLVGGTILLGLYPLPLLEIIDASVVQLDGLFIAGPELKP
ncbi:MAG: NADH-quinone oxidoreductase subunit M [Thiolinea sp.]